MQRRDFLHTGFFAMPLLAGGLSRSKSVKALFVTDMHLSPAIDRSGRAAGFLLDYIRKHTDIQLVINGGDSVYDVARLRYPAGEDLWRFWRSFRDQISIPVYNCLGNHDIYEWELGHDLLPRPEAGKQPALQHLGMPGNYYSFKAGRWKFLVLDSHTYVAGGYKGALDPEQLKWLAGELAQDAGYRLAVISHIPILSACAALYLDPDKHYLFPKIAERLSHTDAPFVFEALKGRRVELFLHGHLHMQETIYYKDSLIYNGGAFCADMWRGPFHAFKSCFTLIDFPDSGAPRIQRIDLPDNF
jgi:3',5'-cyclic AMP phosphodiesterase CpdA